MTLEPLSRAVVKRYLDADGGNYTVDEEGDFLVEYEYDEECDCELSVWLGVMEADTYSIRIAGEKMFPRAEWDRLVWICNDWNADMTYPAAYLALDVGGPDEADIRLDYCVTLEAGVTPEQIQNVTESIVDGAFEFWAWAHREHGI